jgi:hypothetical protein
MESALQPQIAPVALALNTVEDPSKTSALPSSATARPVVVSNTPTGAGDPNAIVCRAPQPITGSDQSGPRVCLQNFEWWKVAMNGKDIAPDGKTLIDRLTVKNPKGEGDPDAITCRAPQILDNGATIARYSPVVCRPNSFWADAIKNHQVVDVNGKLQRRGPEGGQLKAHNNITGYAGAPGGTPASPWGLTP